MRTNYPKGFFMEKARQIVKDNPGLTMREVAERFHRDYPDFSRAKNPVQSLATTLAKQVREGHEPSIEARGRPLRFYYKDDATPVGAGKDATHSVVGQPSPVSVITFTAGDTQFRGPATKENIRRIKQWLEEMEADAN